MNIEDDVKIPALFPFHLSMREGKALWLSWFIPRRAEIDETHGSLSFVGRNTKGADHAGMVKSWSWYEVDVEIIDEWTVVFHTYGMLNSFSGGRGDEQESFVHRYVSNQTLSKFVEDRKQSVARHVCFARQVREQERMQQLAIAATYKELYGNN